jgi:uncharacterized protein (DUF885 family)
MKRNSASALKIADKAFDIFFKRSLSHAVGGVSDFLDADISSISEAEARKSAKESQELLTEAEVLIKSGVSHNDEMLLSLVSATARDAVDGAKYYWHTFEYDPFFNYMAMYFGMLSTFPLINVDYAETYVRLVESLAGLSQNLLTKAHGQHERGILMPKPLAKLSAGVFASYVFEDAENTPLSMSAARLGSADYDAAPFRARIDAAVGHIIQSCKEMSEYLAGEYYDAAPNEVGVAQYPNGSEYYTYCVKKHTTLDITPQEVFRLGAELRQGIEEKMASIRKAEGYDCSREEFTAIFMNDPKWRMNTPEEFGRRLSDCVKKIEPLMNEYFGLLPIKTPCAAVRLTPDLEPYYFNGVYCSASPPMKMQGEFRYNGMNMEQKNPLKTASLAYHELLPGHHYQVTVIQEIDDLHPFARASVCTAYSEGWAEYAAAFAGEIGLYSSPLSEYGRLEMDLYLTNFLTIDSSVNAMGWHQKALEQFMAPYLPDYQGERLANQLMRLSQGMPAFCTAYKLGSLKMTEYREEAEKRLGNLFDIKEFHKTVLEWGSIPMWLLKKHIDWYVDRKLEERA